MISHWLPTTIQVTVSLQSAVLISIAAGLFELSYITLQAARGRHSHFNFSTPVESFIAVLMGLGALLILAPAVVIGLNVAIGLTPGWKGSIRAGVALGLLGGAALTGVTGFRVGRSLGFSPRVQSASSRRMLFTGWSLDGADQRPAHFLAVHMMQVVPAAALTATMLLPPTPALIISSAIGVGWAALTLTASRLASAGGLSRIGLAGKRRATRPFPPFRGGL